MIKSPSVHAGRTFCHGLWLLLACGLAACSSPPAVERPRLPGSAVVEMLNLTPYTWRITAVTGIGSLAGSQVVPPNSMVAMRLPANAYTFEQGILDPDGKEGPRRRIAMTLVADTRYRWPLATLRAGTDHDMLERGKGYE
jgi:hypothetical protein